MILLGDSATVLKSIVDECIDLTVTSPPYDNLRTYGNNLFQFESIVKELYRVTKSGGIVVWIIGDRTEKADETGTSFKQALYFKEIGFKLHDTMIYSKKAARYPEVKRYWQIFEYMFVFVKGKIKTFNPIKDQKSKKSGLNSASNRQSTDLINIKKFRYNEYHTRSNIWEYDTGFNISTKDLIAFDHPAIFPEALAQDHIKSWSNEGDVILDPFAGSGTTLKVAHKLNRKWVGIEINPDYIKIAKKRLIPYIQQKRL